MQRRAAARVLGVVTALLAGAPAAAIASGRIDTAHAAAHRRAVDACIVRGAVIYTDPYVGAGLSPDAVVKAIALMCAAPLRLEAEDLGLAAPDAERLARHTIEAALRGQLPTETGGASLQNAR